jgi:hypothetical protein
MKDGIVTRGVLYDIAGSKGFLTSSQERGFSRKTSKHGKRKPE